MFFWQQAVRLNDPLTVNGRLRFQYFPIKELQKEAKTKAQLGLFRVPKEKEDFTFSSTFTNLLSCCNFKGCALSKKYHNGPCCFLFSFVGSCWVGVGNEWSHRLKTTKQLHDLHIYAKNPVKPPHSTAGCKSLARSDASLPA